MTLAPAVMVGNETLGALAAAWQWHVEEGAVWSAGIAEQAWHPAWERSPSRGVPP